MRYYEIELTDADSNAPIVLTSFQNQTAPALGSAPIKPGVISSLLADGSTNPAALNIEVDIDQQPLHIGDLRSYVRIYGLDLRDIYRKDLNNQNITLKVGMSAGLPLANPAQKGLVVKGSIWQAFGNWLGTDMTLDLIVGVGGDTGVAPGMGAQKQPPQPYVFVWKKGQGLADAISGALSAGPLGGLDQDFTSIAGDRTANADKTGYYFTLVEFAQLIQRLTAGQRGADDQGVVLHQNGQKIKATDTSSLTPSNAIAIDFKDLIGQVTWYEPLKLTCKLVMRGDLEIGGFVKFTAGVPVQTLGSSLSSLASPSQSPQNMLGIAQGATLWVERAHHWGNYRQADALAWNTTLGLVMLG